MQSSEREGKMNLIKEKNNLEKKEMIVEINGKTQAFKMKIIRREKDSKEVMLELVDFLYNPGIKVFSKIEVKIFQNNEIFIFDSEVLSYENNIFIIKEPNNIRKLQRRKSKRYDYISDVEVKKSNHSVFGKCFNLSKGGFGFYCKEFFYTGDILFVSLHCPVQRKIYNLEVTIVDLFIEDNGYIRYGVKFADWVEREFDYLLRFLDNREKNDEIRRLKKEEEKIKKAELEEQSKVIQVKKGMLSMFRRSL